MLINQFKNSYLQFCRTSNNSSDINEICITLHANAKELAIDSLDEHKLALLNCLNMLVELNLDSVSNLFSVIIPLIATNEGITSNKDESIRFNYVTLMSKVYDLIPKLRPYAKIAIAKGFSDKSVNIQNYLYRIWDSEERLHNDPGTRLVAIMKDIYSADYDNSNFTSNAIVLLLGLAKKSSDYNRKIYEQPLSKCSFNKLNIFEIAGGADRQYRSINRSQPLIPLSASFLQAADLMSSQEKDQPKEGDNSEANKESAAKGNVQQMEDIPTGMMRATQMPLFSQTIEQSLIVGKAESGAYLFGESFYGITSGKTSADNVGGNLESVSSSKKETGANSMMEIGNEEEMKGGIQKGLQQEFKVPELAGRKGKKGISKFLASGSFTFGPQLIGGKIRYNPLGVMASSKLGTQNIREEQENKWKARMQAKLSPSVTVCREYRIGELPDIEIMHKDIIEPLRLLCQKDPSIASEIFVSLFIGIYFAETVEDVQSQLRKHLGELLDLQSNQSGVSSYQTVYTLHQAFIKLIKEGVEVNINKAKFGSAEQNALSFQTSILAIEHAIIALHQRGKAGKAGLGKIVKGEEMKSIEAVKDMIVANSITAPGISDENKQLWAQLYKLYKVINDLDTANGIYLMMKNHSDLISTLQAERYNELALLSSWDELSHALQKDPANENELFEPSHMEELSLLLRARARNEKTWEQQTKDMERWLQSPQKKHILLNHFSYELAIHSIIQQDLDRATYYVDRELTKVQHKWANINSVSFATMHYLIQYLQKIHEFYECINLLKRGSSEGSEKLKEKGIDLCKKWKDRSGNVYFDSMNTWDDILHARCLYIDIIATKCSDYKVGLNNVKETKDIIPHFYTQAARAAYKKKLFNCTDKYLKLALKQRIDPSSTSIELIYPVIKLKAKQHQIESIKLDAGSKVNKYLKIIEIINGENAKVGNSSVELLLLSYKLSQVVAKEYFSGGMLDDYAKCIQTCFEILGNCETHMKPKESDSSLKLKQIAKVHYNYSTFCDNILRDIDSEYKDAITTHLSKISINTQSLCINILKHGFAAINANYQKATYMIPRLIEIMTQNYQFELVGRTFAQESAITPAWIFLPWVNQLIAIMDDPSSQAVASKVMEMAEKYPQPVFYTFKVTQSNKEINLLNMKQLSHSMLSDNITGLFENFISLNSWVEALDGLIYPEHRMKYWLELFKEVFSSEATKQADILKKYIVLCNYDLFVVNKKFVGQKIGTYNKKFIQILGRIYANIFGVDGSKIDAMNYQSFATSMNSLLKKLGELIPNLPEGYQKLSAFSEYLDEYNSNDIKNPRDLLEIPGQYKRNIEPSPDRHIKIASLNKTLLILGSIRRPKRIELHGTNEKSYYMLIKGGEDLRLDERLQQLFSLMNEIFSGDTDCKSRSISIKQFNVIPMTNRMGAIEWVTDTMPLKQLIQKQYSALGITDLRKSPAHLERLKWMNQACQAPSITEQHMKLLSVL